MTRDIKILVIEDQKSLLKQYLKSYKNLGYIPTGALSLVEEIG